MYIENGELIEEAINICKENIGSNSGYKILIIEHTEDKYLFWNKVCEEIYNRYRFTPILTTDRNEILILINYLMFV